MLARNQPPANTSGESGPTNGPTNGRATSNSGYGDSAQSRKAHVEGDPHAARSLTLHFSQLVENLKGVPDPDPHAGSYYSAGADFLAALRHDCVDFGRAAPGVPAGAPIAEQILGLTDEAFDRAEELLLVANDDAAFRQRITGPEVQMLLVALGHGLSIRDATEQIQNLTPATDTKMGGEFF